MNGLALAGSSFVWEQTAAECYITPTHPLPEECEALAWDVAYYLSIGAACAASAVAALPGLTSVAFAALAPAGVAVAAAPFSVVAAVTTSAVFIAIYAGAAVEAIAGALAVAATAGFACFSFMSVLFAALGEAIAAMAAALAFAILCFAAMVGVGLLLLFGGSLAGWYWLHTPPAVAEDRTEEAPLAFGTPFGTPVSDETADEVRPRLYPDPELT
jgi:hypothetical protein